MENVILKKAQQFLLEERTHYGSSGQAIAGYAIGQGLLALAEQLGNLAQAIADSKKKE